MSNLDREQALLQAGAQMNGLEWPRIEDGEDEPVIEVYVEPLRDYLARIWNPLHAMTCHVDPPGLTERLPELGTVVPKTEPVSEAALQTSDAHPVCANLSKVSDFAYKFGGWGA
jgi:hypothetical protein